MRLATVFTLVLFCLISACGDDGGADSGALDSAATDSGADSATTDGAPDDSGSVDSANPDGGADSGVLDGAVDAGGRDAATDGASDAAVDTGGECTPGAVDPCPAPSSCASEGTRTCGADGRFGVCRYVYSRELCGNGVDDDDDGTIDEGCGCSFGAEFCDGTVDDNCDGMVDEGCLDCSTTTCTRWTIPEDRMCRGASDPTGAGACVGPLYCASADGRASTTPPGGCGVPHCGTLEYGDGRQRARYCTVFGRCVGGVPTPEGFTW